MMSQQMSQQLLSQQMSQQLMSQQMSQQMTQQMLSQQHLSRSSPRSQHMMHLAANLARHSPQQAQSFQGIGAGGVILLLTASNFVHVSTFGNDIRHQGQHQICREIWAHLTPARVPFCSV